MASLGSLGDDHRPGNLDTDKEGGKASTVVTLKPFAPVISSVPLPQRNRRYGRNKSKIGNEQVEILPGVYEPANYCKFLTVKFDDKRAEDSDMFRIHKEITTLCGREPNISFENDGSLLIETTSQEESEKLRSLEGVCGIKASCTPHKSMNHCRGVIRSPYLMKYSEERLLEEFRDQKVVDVKQMKKKIDGVLTPLPTYLLTFQLIRLPHELKAAWLRLEVRPYIPSPRRCFYCQRFGHVSDSCRRKLKGEKRICYNCGQEEHDNCNNPSFCVNCMENHPSSSKTCDRFILEREIQSVRAKEHVTFQEAKKRVMTRYIRPGVTFASVLDKQKKNTQLGTSKSSPVTTNNSVPSSNKSPTNMKRRRSIEEQSTSPISKSNRYETLTDEMDAENFKSDIDLGQDLTPALARSVVRAEVHVSACSVEQAGPPASADVGESAGAVSSGDSGKSVEESPPAGFWDPPGATSLTALGESAGSISSAGSLEQIENLKDITKNTTKKEKTLTKSTANSISKADASMSGSRKIKIPQINSSAAKPKIKTENKNLVGRPSGRVSSKSNK